MSKHDTEIALRQILSHARESVEILRGKTRADLDNDRVLNLALTRLLEIIGEAANRVPDSVQEKYPHLPCLQMIGLRNRLIHGYDVVDLDVLWDTIQDDLPALIVQLREALGQRD